MSSSLYEWGLSRPWCITHEALDLMLSLAARQVVDAEELKQAMHGPKALALRDGQRRDDSPTMRTVDGVARIVIDGPIYRYADYFTRYSGGITTEQIAKDLQRALDDPTVGAIALVVDSPGGDATGINELSDAIYAARGRKPIGAYVEGYGASAAYWIASSVAPGMLLVDDTALVGSIGTILGVPDPTKRPSNRIDIVSSQSPKKRVDPTTAEGRAVLQQIADDMTEVFISKVMRNRTMTRDQVLAVEGGLRIGEQAIAAGLADRLGSEDQLLRELAARASQRPPLSVPPVRVPGGSPLKFERTPMDWKAFWNGMFGAAAEAEGTPIAAQLEVAAPTTRTVQISAEQLAQIEAAAAPLAPQAAAVDPREERIAALEKQLTEQRTQQIQTAAVAFADGAIRSNQAYPSERTSLIRMYVAAAHDDDRDPWPEAQAGEAGSRVALLQGQIAARPAHSLTAETVRVGEGGVLESGAQPGLTPERRNKLLGLTPLGQAVRTKSA